MSEQMRQGDVYLCPVPIVNMPETRLIEMLDLVLAYGEVTGHAHRILPSRDHATLREDAEGRRYLVVERATTLSHQEHGAIIIDAGVYRVIRQREYTPGRSRYVAD